MVQFVVFLFFSLDIFVFFFDVNMRSWIIILDNPGLETETGKCIFLQNGLISCQKSKFPEPKQNTGISLCLRNAMVFFSLKAPYIFFYLVLNVSSSPLSFSFYLIGPKNVLRKLLGIVNRQFSDFILCVFLTVVEPRRVFFRRAYY